MFVFVKKNLTNFTEFFSVSIKQVLLHGSSIDVVLQTSDAFLDSLFCCQRIDPFRRDAVVTIYRLLRR